MLKVEKLTCRRGLRLVFRDISFALSPGAFLLVTGANGSGNGFAILAAAGAASGAVLWQNTDITKEWPMHRERLRHIGHQDAGKPELTASEMTGYWQALRSGKREKTSLSALEKLGIGHLAEQPVRYLSAGQKRRLALTRLVLDDAPLWLLMNLSLR